MNKKKEPNYFSLGSFKWKRTEKGITYIVF